jgi:DNA-binding NtrC family response regulator
VRSFPQVTEKSPPLRVLVVDDESLIRWSIAETLADAGHIVIEAEDGATAIRALTGPADPIDAVLLDYRLPDSNDLTLLASIRRLSPHSPVILMTAYGTPEVTRGALDLGVYRVMSKPFEMHELEELLLEACGSHPR